MFLHAMVDVCTHHQSADQYHANPIGTPPLVLNAHRLLLNQLILLAVVAAKWEWLIHLLNIISVSHTFNTDLIKYEIKVHSHSMQQTFRRGSIGRSGFNTGSKNDSPTLGRELAKSRANITGCCWLFGSGI
jgi:hypothetical protein